MISLGTIILIAILMYILYMVYQYKYKTENFAGLISDEILMGNFIFPTQKYSDIAQ